MYLSRLYCTFVKPIFQCVGGLKCSHFLHWYAIIFPKQIQHQMQNLCTKMSNKLQFNNLMALIPMMKSVKKYSLRRPIHQRQSCSTCPKRREILIYQNKTLLPSFTGYQPLALAWGMIWPLQQHSQTPYGRIHRGKAFDTFLKFLLNKELPS